MGKPAKRGGKIPISLTRKKRGSLSCPWHRKKGGMDSSAGYCEGGEGKGAFPTVEREKSRDRRETLDEKMKKVKIVVIGLRREGSYILRKGGASSQEDSKQISDPKVVKQ